MKNLPLLLAAAVLGAACSAGSVTVPAGLDKFGSAKSGVWLVVTSRDEGDVDVDHNLVMSSDRGFCGKAQKAYQELADVTQEFEGRYEETYEEIYDRYEGSDDYEAAYQALNRAMCNLYLEYFDALGDATNGMINKTNVVSLYTVTQGDDYDYDYEPAAGTFTGIDRDGGERGDRWYGGSIAWYDQNPYRTAADSLRDADCDSLGPEDYWYDAIEDDLDNFEPIGLYGGTLTLDAKGDDAFKAELTGASVDEADGLDLKGTFKRCDVSVDGYAYLPF